MKSNTFLKVLSSLVLLFTLVVTTLPTTTFALQIYPVDYTFTGIGLPGTTAFITVKDDKDVSVEFSGVIDAKGLYTIPAKIATATGQISYNVETKDGLEATIIFYDVSTLDTAAGGTIEPAIYEGEGATPNSNVKITFPDGSSSVVKTDDKGAYKAFAPNTQDAGPVTVSNLNGLGLEIGTPIAGNYKGGVEVIQTTQVKQIQSTTVSSSKTAIVNKPVDPVTPVTPVVPATPNVILQNATPATVKTPVKATVRTGGTSDYSIFAIITLIVTSFFILKNKKINN
jgi:hypothetical protein